MIKAFFFLFVSLPLIFPEGDLYTQDTNMILGKWKMCRDSAIDNPPTFLTCRYEIVFRENGKYAITDNDNIIDCGRFIIKKHSFLRDKPLHLLEFLESESSTFELEKYFPIKSLILFSEEYKSIIFLQLETKEIATPYFLKKQIL